MHISQKNGSCSGRPTEAKFRLPPLESFSTTAPSEHQKVAVILRILRNRAQTTRNTQRQPFYSIRDVADHFTIPVTTASRIFDRLKEEGLLCSVWGSKTFLEPAELNRRIRTRGIVGLPVSAKLFFSARDYRSLFLALREALWKIGFITRLLFYEEHDLHLSKSGPLLPKTCADLAICYLPNPKCVRITRILKDNAIRLITIAEESANMTQYRYCITREKAIRDGLTEWKKAGINSVVLFTENVKNPSRAAETILRDIGLQHAVVGVACNDGSSLLNSLFQRERGFIFSSTELVIRVAAQNPVEFQRLVTQFRVMFVEGAVQFQALEPRGFVDLVAVDWRPLTRQVCNDLQNLSRLQSSNSMKFEARWQPQVPITESNN